MTLLIVYILLALGVSFLCSIMEAVLLSITPSYVHMREQETPAAGARLRRLKGDIDRPLAAILSLNTIAHTVGAAGAGAQAAHIFGDAYVGVISGVLTFLILVISEIIPKTLGAAYWRQLATPVARMLVPLIWSMWPLVKMSQGLTKLLSRGRDGQASISREEIQAMAAIGEEEGVFEADESRILKNLFRFSELRVRDVMTPRIVAFTLPEQMTIAEAIAKHGELRFSRIPLHRGSRDDITGYALKDQILLKAAQEGADQPLDTLRRDILVVPDSLALPELFARLLDRLEHIALVVDEYGGMAGIVTMEDVVETLLGLEIVDEVDSARDMQAMARQQWLRRARRLGLVPNTSDGLTADGLPYEESDAVIRYGLTGGPPPTRHKPAPPPDPAPDPAPDGAAGEAGKPSGSE